MKKVVVFLLVATVCGCASIDGKRLEKDIANLTDTVGAICGTAELFSAIGKSVPGVEHCEKALQTADLIQGYGDTLAIADTLRCVEKNDVKSVDFVECISGVKWWPVLVDRINTEVQRAVE